MVKIEEMSSNDDGASPSSSGASQQQRAPTVTISQYVSDNLAECCLNATRVLTIVFTISYLLPFLSPVAPESAYYKAFAAAAATNALRMQQRVGAVSLTREFFAGLMLEDSCHYLFYCILFLTSAPVSMALLPISLFAGLHSASFLTKVLSATGRGDSAMSARLGSVLHQHTTSCLGVIACAEIFLVPLLISLIFVGRGSLFMPFVYYRFLTLRYASRRNPHTRQAMYQMRCSLDQVAASPNCPAVVRTLIHKSVTFISSLAPQF